jgi:decaprenylphospho-beta-D-ribofuranose 2-oxidase
MVKVKDLIGLNETMIDAMPIVDTTARAIDQINAKQSLSIAGSRHSQGGHTMLANAPMLLTECMNIVTYNANDNTVTAQAGATWNNIHHALHPHGHSVLVQQSSAHFTVGGSLSVNCHGRDPSQGPLSSTVESVTVLLEDGTTQITSPGQNLFKAVVGGYSSCGMILEATFKTCENRALKRSASQMSIDEYVDKITIHQASHDSNSPDWPAIHFAWLNFSKSDFFENVLSVDYSPTTQNATSHLIMDEWGTTEAQQAAWATLRKQASYRDVAWGIVSAAYTTPSVQHRTNCLREAVGFTAYLEKTKADVLQEYFVPLAQLKPFIAALKTLFKGANANVLSCTLRVVQQDDSTHLSYCKNSMMMSVVLDINVKVVGGKPNAAAMSLFDQAIELALNHGGTYYLPYYGFANSAAHPTQFRRAYPSHTAQKTAMNTFAPNRKFDNQFLSTYLP